MIKLITGCLGSGMSYPDTPLALPLAASPAEQGAFLVSPGRAAAQIPVTNILETDHLSFRQFTELKADLDFLKERYVTSK